MFPSPDQMRDHESSWFASHGTVAEAVEEAGAGIARIFRQFFPNPGTLWLFLGHGHNAADALVAARHLAGAGWTVRHHFANPDSSLAPLATTALTLLASASRGFVPESPDASLPRPWVAVDGLCGIGARLPIGGPLGRAIRSINHWRDSHGASVLAIDLPSGLDGGDGSACDPCVTADLTITIAAVKRGLVRNPARVGRLALLPLATLPAPDPSGGPDEILLTAETIGPWLPPRPHDLHKGGAGRIALIAGSPGMTGAAALMAMGALHGGAGLITIFTSPECVAEVARRCPPEAMVRALPAGGLQSFPCADFDVIGLGPGCARTLDATLPGFVRHCPCPLVIDADAINGLVRQCGATALPIDPTGAARLLTPHPGEFARLAPDLAGLPRAEAATLFVARYPGATLLMKGAISIVAAQGMPLAHNQSGNSGLASGGTGDVLAGLAAALLHRTGNHPWRAAAAAAWLHGRSAELICTHGNTSTESLLASTTAIGLGAAFLSLVRRDS